MFGTQEVGFSLAEFRVLVQREWTDPPGVETLPEERYGAVSVARALVAWAALQDATSVWGMQKSLKAVKEIPMDVWRGERSSEGPSSETKDEGKESEDIEITVTSDEQLPDGGGTLVQAQISHFRPPGAYIWAEPEEEEPQDEPPIPVPAPQKTTERRESKFPAPFSPVVDLAHLRPILRRMSHMVIGGYGGASFLFFGLAFPSVGDAAASGQLKSDPSEPGQNIADIVNKAESESRAPAAQKAEPRRSWWGLIMGQHDQEIFERFAAHGAEQAEGKANTAVLGDAGRLPRFWVLTDHARRQVVLVLRGEWVIL